jgi:hypothetical protein
MSSRLFAQEIAPMSESDASPLPEPNDSDPLLSPSERRNILEREIKALTRAGLRLVSQFHYVALLAPLDSSELVELYVDGHGRVRRT